MMYAGKENFWGLLSGLPGIVEVNFMKAFSTLEIARVYSICQLLHHSSIFRLFAKQKAQLSEVLDNMERWWNQSLPALESIYNESMEIQGSGTAGITPTVLPIRIKHRWGTKTMQRVATITMTAYKLGLEILIYIISLLVHTEALFSMD